jgi:spermidine synthase
VPEVFDCFPYFHADAAEVLADPRIHHYADDGRNFLLVRPKKYDVISVDPAPPIWSAGTVNLYTKEFFDLCKSRLNDHGILCLWIPPVRDTDAMMLLKTFCTVFPNTYVWRSGGPASGLFMIGFQNPQDPAQEGFRTLDNEAEILADLNEWKQEVPSLDLLKSLLFMTPQQLAMFTADSPIITDDHPYTEFPLWRSLFQPLRFLQTTLQ